MVRSHGNPMKASYHIDSPRPFPVHPMVRRQSCSILLREEGPQVAAGISSYPSILPSVSHRTSSSSFLLFFFFFFSCRPSVGFAIIKKASHFSRDIKKKKTIQAKESWSAAEATCKCEGERPGRVLKCCDILKSLMAEHESRWPL